MRNINISKLVDAVDKELEQFVFCNITDDIINDMKKSVGNAIESVAPAVIKPPAAESINSIWQTWPWYRKFLWTLLNFLGIRKYFYVKYCNTKEQYLSRLRSILHITDKNKDIIYDIIHALDKFYEKENKRWWYHPSPRTEFKIDITIPFPLEYIQLEIKL